MRKFMKKGCATLVLLAFMLNGIALAAEERHVWAAQGDVAFFTENGKIGLQTVAGKVLHEAVFDKASCFDESGQANVYFGNTIGRINRTGNMVVEPLNCDSMWLLGTGTDQVLAFTVNGSNFPDGKNRYGFLSLDGKIISEAKWNDIRAFHNGFAYVKTNDKCSKIDMQGNILNDGGWEEFPDFDSTYGFYTISATEMTIFDPQGEKIATFDVSPDENSSGIYTLGGKIYLNGQVYTREDWSHFKWLSEGRYAFQQNKKWGVVDQDMNEIWPARWDYIFNNHTPARYWNYSWEEHTPKGIWLVCDGSYYGWMDETGKIVVEPVYANIAPVGDNLWLAGTNDLSGNPQGDHLILNEKGEVVRTIPESVGTAVSYGEGYIRYYQNESGDWGYMNSKGKLLSRFGGEVNLYNSSTVSDGRILIRRMGSEGDELGFADVYGNIISSPDWKEISDFSHGYAVVDTAEGLRYIDHKGKIVGGEEWDFISNYFFTGSMWIARVGKMNEANEMEYGYINDQGAPICEINFTEDEAWNFERNI